VAEQQPLQEKAARKWLDSRFISKTWLARTLFVAGGTLGILGIIEFWTLLWFANDSNPTWHWIIANDYIKAIVSGTAEAVNRLVV
jgi:hypothetical protein